MDKSYNDQNLDELKNDLLSSDDSFYYLKMWKSFRDEEDPEHKVFLRDTALEIINESDNLKNLLKVKTVSALLDVALPHATPSSYENVIKTIEEDLRLYAVDQYASHVLETLLKCCLKQLQDTERNSTGQNCTLPEDQKEMINSFLLKSCKFVFNNITEFITDNYASHVLRTVIEVVNGIEVPRKLKTKRNAENISSMWNSMMIVPKPIKNLLPGFMERLCDLPHIQDIISDNCGSGVLQTALSAVHLSPDDKKMLKTLVNSIIKGFYGFSDTGTLHEVFTLMPACRLLETVLSVASEKQQILIYDSFFKNKLQLLCIHQESNFAVQRLCDHCKNTEMFDELYSGISSSIAAILEKGWSGILFSLVKACRRLELHQSSMKQCLMDLFQCAEPSDRQDKFAILLMKFVKFDDLEYIKEYPFQVHGSLILQEMLQFKKPKKISRSLLRMENSGLFEVACDANASNVIKVFINSETIDDKEKNQLIEKFTNMEVDLSCSTMGSRPLEAMWAFANLEKKTAIAKRLMKSDKKLLNHVIGKIIFNKFHLANFKNQKYWQKRVEGLHNKRKIRDELLEAFEGSQKKRKAE